MLCRPGNDRLKGWSSLVSLRDSGRNCEDVSAGLQPNLRLELEACSKGAVTSADLHPSPTFSAFYFDSPHSKNHERILLQQLEPERKRVQSRGISDNHFVKKNLDQESEQLSSPKPRRQIKVQVFQNSHPIEKHLPRNTAVKVELQRAFTTDPEGRCHCAAISTVAQREIL